MPRRLESVGQSGRLIAWAVAFLLLVTCGPNRCVGASTNSPAPLERYLEWLKQQLPGSRPDAGYVGSERCRECHLDEHASWHRSYHRTMTQPAVPAAVLGHFDGSTINCGGLGYRVFQEAGGYWAEMPDPDVLMYVVQGGKKLPLEEIPRVKRPVVMTTGSHHYQTYWVTSPRYPGLLQTLPLVFLREDKRWIPRDQAFMRGPNDTERLVTQWNHHCIRCHSTGGNPGLDDKGQLRSEVGELGIACEACHGPGAAHVEKHRLVPNLTKNQPRTADPTIINPGRLDHERSTQVCGQCHGVYVMREEFAMESARNGPLFRPGEDLFRTRQYIQHPNFGSATNRSVELERNRAFYAERWWDDGTVLAGGREYTGLLASACYTRGKMSCLSCHSMHDSDPNGQLSARGASRAACTQCHQESRFTTDVTRHTFHAADSSGSDCLNCHMPHTTYALFKGIRSHQISSPRAETSARFGTPNACNLCHLDRTLAWTQQHLTRWYGHAETALTPEQTNTAASVLWLLKGHAAQRVIAAWHFGWPPAQRISGTNWLAPAVAQLLADGYGPVRYVAARSLRTLPDFADFPFDFLASNSDREAARDRALKRWNRDATELRPNPAILVNEAGRFDEAQAADLVRRQDQRPVTIQE
ncbi:MAG TPA: cytochrome c3 family protein [Verrucomicrobiota bacterium]|nr:cytochrome c3 family protein [Verrucomicrobiota bacterium]